MPGLERIIGDAYRRDDASGEPRDAELSLYDGFLDDGDRRAMERLQGTLQEGSPWPPFSPDDERVRTLATRLKARLRPQELDAVERAEWREHVALCQREGLGRRLSLKAYRARIGELRGRLGMLGGLLCWMSLRGMSRGWVEGACWFVGVFTPLRKTFGFSTPPKGGVIGKHDSPKGG